jgi:hypothetical protein
MKRFVSRVSPSSFYESAVIRSSNPGWTAAMQWYKGWRIIDRPAPKRLRPWGFADTGPMAEEPPGNADVAPGVGLI